MSSEYPLSPRNATTLIRQRRCLNPRCGGKVTYYPYECYECPVCGVVGPDVGTIVWVHDEPGRDEQGRVEALRPGDPLTKVEPGEDENREYGD